MRPRFEVDWEVWALPLCMGWIAGQIFVLRIGPLAWFWGEFGQIERALEKAEKRFKELRWDRQ